MLFALATKAIGMAPQKTAEANAPASEPAAYAGAPLWLRLATVAAAVAAVLLIVLALSGQHGRVGSGRHGTHGPPAGEMTP